SVDREEQRRRWHQAHRRQVQEAVREAKDLVCRRRIGGCAGQPDGGCNDPSRLVSARSASTTLETRWLFGLKSASVKAALAFFCQRLAFPRKWKTWERIMSSGSSS